jgi:hypothetical protein
MHTSLRLIIFLLDGNFNAELGLDISYLGSGKENMHMLVLSCSFFVIFSQNPRRSMLDTLSINDSSYC